MSRQKFLHLGFWFGRRLFCVYWKAFKNPILGNRKKIYSDSIYYVSSSCMYAVMQMIQNNTSIIIAESTFYLCMEVSSFVFSQMQKKPTDFLPDCIRANKSSLLFCYNVYSTEIGMQKKILRMSNLNCTYIQQICQFCHYYKSKRKYLHL